jgi:stage V sporulation protein B
MPRIGRTRRASASGPAAAATVLGGGVADAGAVRNTLLQLLSQIAGVAFTGGLTLYLVRALGPSGYGVYALAVSVGALLLFPAMLGVPMSVGRFLADHRGDLDQVRAILVLGLKLQVPTAVVASVGLFAASGAVADAYGDPRLGWPLRWVAVSISGQTLFAFLTATSTSVRRVAVGLWMAVIESATETAGSVAFVIAGAGAAGATLGKAIGYSVASAAGFYLMLRLVGGARRGGAVRRKVALRTITSYAGAMFVVDVTWGAIAQVDILLIGALLSSTAVGSFGAILRIVTVLGYLGSAVSAGVAPRLSRGGGGPDTQALSRGIRYLIIVQGLVIAPMVVWSKPIVGVLLGSGYRSSAEIMQVLAVMAFVSAPASLISVAVTYLGEARRRVVIMLGTLVLGLVSTYVLLRTVGLVGAAIADDIVQIAYVSAHLWICSRLITLDLRRLAWSGVRTLLAAGAMALVMLAIGTDHLSPVQWLAGACAGGGAFAAVLLGTRELTITELREVAARLWIGSRAASA